MAGASGSSSNARFRKASKGRRNWNAEEEDFPLVCLKELVATRWKSDNGFRPGYINKLTDMMRVRFPRANIQPNPHMVSKLTGWKRNYGSLVGILNRSGVGFNVHGDFTVDADDETWERACNADPNTVNIRGKSWPYYDRWVEVFGKDRATGDTAVDVMEYVHDLIIEDNHNGQENVGVDPIEEDEDNVQADDAEDSVLNSTARGGSSARGGNSAHGGSPSGIPKRRKNSDNNDKDLCDLLGKMQQDTNDRLDCISFRIGTQADVRKERKEIFKLLDEIPSLSLDEQLDVCEILVDNPARMELFTSLPQIARETYVQRLLTAKGI